MSININNIYCSHWLKNEYLNSFSNKEKKFAYIKSNPHFHFHIKDSIHYNALINNNFDFYKEYINITNQREHSLDKFLNLKENFDINKLKKIKIEHNYKSNKYIILDGVHRLCLLVFFKLIDDSIPLEYLDIIYDNNTIEFVKQGLLETKSITHYNGWGNGRGDFGYHSFNIFNMNFKGQRTPNIRLEIIKKHIDLKNKNILDVGCNSGGMLLHLFDINKGYGIDYDINCINFANSMHKLLKFNNEINFIQRDLDKIDMDSEIKIDIDIIFLFSLGSWIEKWKYIYEWCLKKSRIIIFETNNDKEGKKQIELFKRHNCKINLISESSDDDTTGNNKRKMYLINTV